MKPKYFKFTIIIPLSMVRDFMGALRPYLVEGRRKKLIPRPKRNK